MSCSLICLSKKPAGLEVSTCSPITSMLRNYKHIHVYIYIHIYILYIHTFGYVASLRSCCSLVDGFSSKQSRFEIFPKNKKHGFARGWSALMHAFFLSEQRGKIWSRFFLTPLIRSESSELLQQGVPLESSSTDTKGCQFCCFQPAGTVCQVAAGWDSGEPHLHLALHLF